MKTTTKKKQSLFTVLFVTLVLSTSTYARSGTPNFKRLADKLSLSGSQKTAFVKVMQEQHQKKRTWMLQHRQDTQRALTSVLDAQQLSTFKKHMKKRLHKRRKPQEVTQ